WGTGGLPANPALATVLQGWICPADNRTNLATLVPDPQGDITVAFTEYLAFSGITQGSQPDKKGVFYIKTSSINSKQDMKDITDGLSNTLFVGERPPSADLDFGWWFAGAGFPLNGTSGAQFGTGDVLMGSYETAYWNALTIIYPECKGQPVKVGHQAG